MSKDTGPGLLELFHSARYSDVVDRALLADDAWFSPSDTPVVVAAMAALGQRGDAELLLSHQRELLTPDETAFALHHLAAAALGTGQNAAARGLLGNIFSLRNQMSTADGRFFLYHAIAWYRYATGRLKSALWCAERAAGFARSGASEYARYLHLELLGHLQALTGDVEGGVPSLKAAAEMAKELGRWDSARALKTAASVYLARYRQGPKEASSALKAELAATPAGDRGGRASLLLELARQYLLSRRAAPAREALAGATRIVLGMGSRRYEATLDMRLVDLLTMDGAMDQALIVSQAALRTLSLEADLLLEQELTARRQRLFRALQLTEAETGEVRRLLKLERRTGLQMPGLPPLGAEIPADNAALNHRQIAFMKELREGELIDVHAYRKRFDVSEITACRDLAALARGKFVRRIGKARATRYARS